MGTVTDNDFGLNQRFFDSKVDAIFKYEGDGFGDRGEHHTVLIHLIKKRIHCFVMLTTYLFPIFIKTAK
jgi:hypothetical protein